MNQNTVLTRADSVTFEVVAGEAILIDMNRGTYFSLNEVGTVFWEMLDGTKTVRQLAGQIAGQYNEKSAQFVGGLEALVDASPAAVASGVPALAETYNLEPADVEGYLEPLRSGSSPAELLDDLTVPVDAVQADLLELAETMVAEKLVTVTPS